MYKTLIQKKFNYICRILTNKIIKMENHALDTLGFVCYIITIVGAAITLGGSIGMLIAKL